MYRCGGAVSIFLLGMLKCDRDRVLLCNLSELYMPVLRMAHCGKYVQCCDMFTVRVPGCNVAM